MPKNLANRVNTYAISILAVEQLLRYSTECTQQKKNAFTSFLQNYLGMHGAWICIKFSLENKLLSLPMKSY